MSNKLYVLALFLVTSHLFAQNSKRPNVVFILADDLGINALHCYGNKWVESPHIDKLFSEGMHFTNGYSNDPTCAPSRASIMSGQYVPRHKVYRVADRYQDDKTTLRNMKYLPPEVNRVKGEGKGMSPEVITIAEALQANEYATAAYGKWHLGNKGLGMTSQGFDEGFEIKGHYGYITIPQQEDLNPEKYSSDIVTEKSIAFMQQSVNHKQPFYLYVPYYLVHKPLQPKKEILQYFEEKYKDNDSIGKDEMKVLAMIKSLDNQVGRLMNALEALGISEETVVVFTSDNGHYRTESNIFTRPYRGTKGETLEGGIRVPYIFKWKGKIPSGSKSEEPIIHVDLYPTFLGLTETKAPEDHVLDGEDISPLLLQKTEELKRDALVWEYTNYARYNERKKEFATSWVNVIQMGGFKMTEEVETDKYYLYNLNDDPYEINEVSATYPNKLEALKKRLGQWKIETQYQAPRENPDYKK